MALLRRIAVVSILILSVSIAQAADESVIALGRSAYIAQCARCHGPEGKGNGTDAVRLYVPPRDLTSGRFKFKTTKQGTPPSDEDLIHGIIGHGVTGSGMPSFSSLEETTKKALAEYIKTLSPAFHNNAQPEPIAKPANMKASVDLKKGAEIFEKLQCALCHGANGRANGTSANSLVDAWQHPIKPTNLSQGWTYGGGPRAIDVYHRIMAGIDGAPMPSYEGAVTNEDAWILSKYITSLQIQPNWSDDIAIKRVEGALPTKADDEIWKEAVKTDIVLDGYFVQGGKRLPFVVNHLSIQSVGNKEGLAFRVVWDDPLKDDQNPSDNFMMTIKPKNFNGDVRATLHSLYDADDSALDLTFWNAYFANSIQQTTNNLYNHAHSGERAMALTTANASYDDGRWTLVFTRPFDSENFRFGDDGQPLMASFLIGSGENGETGLRRPASRWMRLSFQSPKTGHH